VSDLRENIIIEKLPEHIAIIMDGNGRWAKKKGAVRIFGHNHAVEAVRQVAEGCAELGIKYLTLYAFSTENWERPREEVNALMQLLISTTRKELDTLQKNNIRLNTIGDFESLPKGCQRELEEGKELTGANDGLCLTLALSYSGRWDILNSVRQIAADCKEGRLGIDQITSETFKSYLSTSRIPDPELIVRTSGEMRISNFLLWEMAYSEIYFTETLWPDFRKPDLYAAILSYQNRERRFGKTSEQVN
jgi:undecaprenyl diphosphate synthase